MPPTATPLTPQERQVLYAIGCGLRDTEIADSLALPEHAVTGLLGCVLAKLGLPDRATAIVHAFDSGLVVPGHGPRSRTARTAARQPGEAEGEDGEPPLRICLLGPLQAWHGDHPVDLGPSRQQTVLAALALCRGRPAGLQELLEAVWGTKPPTANVVPVYVYRLRKALELARGRHPVIGRDRCGYLLSNAVEVDAVRMEQHVTAARTAERAGDLAESVRLTARALELFRGEPLSGLPGPFAELERLRLTERRNTLVRRKVDAQLRLGRHAEAIADLSALAVTRPLDEAVAAMLMCALHREGRPAEALDVFDRIRRQLADELATAPGDMLRRARRSVLCGDDFPLRTLRLDEGR